MSSNHHKTIVAFLHGKKSKKEPHAHSYPLHLFHVSLNICKHCRLCYKERRNTKREVKMGGPTGSFIEEEEGEEGGESQ
jgi:hypothetical protein